MGLVYNIHRANALFFAIKKDLMQTVILYQHQYKKSIEPYYVYIIIQYLYYWELLVFPLLLQILLPANNSFDINLHHDYAYQHQQCSEVCSWQQPLPCKQKCHNPCENRFQSENDSHMGGGGVLLGYGLNNKCYACTEQ